MSGQAITPQRVRTLLVEVVEQILNYPRGRVLIETRSDRRPADGAPYATIWFRDMEPLSQNDGEFYEDESGHYQELDNETFCTVRFSVWGDDAYDDALKLAQGLQTAAMFSSLWHLIGFAGLDSVQDASTQYGGKIQQRAYFNLQFYTCFGKTYPADWFNVSQWRIGLPRHNNYLEEWKYSEEDGNVPDPCNVP